MDPELMRATINSVVRPFRLGDMLSPKGERLFCRLSHAIAGEAHCLFVASVAAVLECLPTCKVETVYKDKLLLPTNIWLVTVGETSIGKSQSLRWLEQHVTNLFQEAGKDDPFQHSLTKKSLTDAASGVVNPSLFIGGGESLPHLNNYLQKEGQKNANNAAGVLNDLIDGKKMFEDVHCVGSLWGNESALNSYMKGICRENFNNSEGVRSRTVLSVVNTAAIDAQLSGADRVVKIRNVCAATDTEMIEDRVKESLREIFNFCQLKKGFVFKLEEEAWEFLLSKVEEIGDEKQAKAKMLQFGEQQAQAATNTTDTRNLGLAAVLAPAIQIVGNIFDMIAGETDRLDLQRSTTKRSMEAAWKWVLRSETLKARLKQNVDNSKSQASKTTADKAMKLFAVTSVADAKRKILLSEGPIASLCHLFHTEDSTVMDLRKAAQEMEGDVLEAKNSLGIYRPDNNSTGAGLMTVDRFEKLNPLLMDEEELQNLGLSFDQVNTAYHKKSDSTGMRLNLGGKSFALCISQTALVSAFHQAKSPKLVNYELEEGVRKRKLHRIDDRVMPGTYSHDLATSRMEYGNYNRTRHHTAMIAFHKRKWEMGREGISLPIACSMMHRMIHFAKTKGLHTGNYSIPVEDFSEDLNRDIMEEERNINPPVMSISEESIEEAEEIVGELARVYTPAEEQLVTSPLGEICNVPSTSRQYPRFHTVPGLDVGEIGGNASFQSPKLPAGSWLEAKAVKNKEEGSVTQGSSYESLEGSRSPSRQLTPLRAKKGRSLPWKTYQAGIVRHRIGSWRTWQPIRVSYERGRGIRGGGLNLRKAKEDRTGGSGEDIASQSGLSAVRFEGEGEFVMEAIGEPLVAVLDKNAKKDEWKDKAPLVSETSGIGNGESASVEERLGFGEEQNGDPNLAAGDSEVPEDICGAVTEAVVLVEEESTGVEEEKDKETGLEHSNVSSGHQEVQQEHSGGATEEYVLVERALAAVDEEKVEEVVSGESSASAGEGDVEQEKRVIAGEEVVAVEELLGVVEEKEERHELPEASKVSAAYAELLEEKAVGDVVGGVEEQRKKGGVSNEMGQAAAGGVVGIEQEQKRLDVDEVQSGQVVPSLETACSTTQLEFAQPVIPSYNISELKFRTIMTTRIQPSMEKHQFQQLPVVIEPGVVLPRGTSSPQVCPKVKEVGKRKWEDPTEKDAEIVEPSGSLSQDSEKGGVALEKKAQSSSGSSLEDNPAQSWKLEWQPDKKKMKMLLQNAKLAQEQPRARMQGRPETAATAYLNLINLKEMGKKGSIDAMTWRKEFGTDNNPKKPPLSEVQKAQVVGIICNMDLEEAKKFTEGKDLSIKSLRFVINGIFNKMRSKKDSTDAGVKEGEVKKRRKKKRSKKVGAVAGGTGTEEKQALDETTQSQEAVKELFGNVAELETVEDVLVQAAAKELHTQPATVIYKTSTRIGSTKVVKKHIHDLRRQKRTPMRSIKGAANAIREDGGIGESIL